MAFGNWATLGGGGDPVAGLGSAFPSLGSLFGGSGGGGSSSGGGGGGGIGIGGYTDVWGNNPGTSSAITNYLKGGLFGQTNGSGSGQSMGGQTGGTDGWGGSGAAGGGGGGGSGSMGGNTGGDDGWGNVFDPSSGSWFGPSSQGTGAGPLGGAVSMGGGSGGGGFDLGSMLGGGSGGSLFGGGGGGDMLGGLMGMFGGGGLSGALGGMMGGGAGAGAAQQPAAQQSSGPDPYQQAYDDLVQQIKDQQTAAQAAAAAKRPDVQFAGGYTQAQLNQLNSTTGLEAKARLKEQFDLQNQPQAEAALKAARTQDQIDADTKADKVKAAKGQAAANGGAYDAEGNYYANAAQLQHAADDYNAKQAAFKAATDKLNGTAGAAGSASSGSSGSGSGSQSGAGAGSQSQGWQYQPPTPEQEKQNKLDTAKANGWTWNKQGYAVEPTNDVIDERPGHENTGSDAASSGSKRKSGGSLWGGW